MNPPPIRNAIRTLAVLLPCLILTNAMAAPIPKTYDVKTYGAKGDGTTLDTAAIQAAIDAASTAGGGLVRIGPGTYRTTTLWLKNDVTLEIEKDALVQASLEQTDWNSCNLQPVIAALSVSNVTLRGAGTVDGGGMFYYGKNTDGHIIPGSTPQQIVGFQNCKNAQVIGLTYRNSVKWTQVYEQCDNLLVDGCVIRNRESCLNRETDGIDIADCRHTVVRDCDIQTGDDALCFKAHGDKFQNPPRVGFDVVFENCTVATTCNATKIGTGTWNDGYDVHFRNITVNKLPNVVRHKNSTPDDTCIAAISMQSNDGGLIHDFTFENYTVNDCNTPIFMEVQNRKMPHARIRKGFGSVKDITVKNFTCLHSSRTSQINVERGGRLENITLENLSIHNFGTFAGTDSPIWLTGKYPDAQRCGEMPAHGLFARCVDNLALKGKIEFFDDGHSNRPATTYEDVTLKP